jgi:hypothetical protein
VVRVGAYVSLGSEIDGSDSHAAVGCATKKPTAQAVAVERFVQPTLVPIVQRIVSVW